MKEEFIPRRFSEASLAIIAKADEIIGEYQAQGFVLTLRQIYYQFVARGLIENKQTEYKRLGSIINDARLAGLLDWEGIEDRVRPLQGVPTWDSPEDGIASLAAQYKEDLWRDQKTRIEVWIEKEALAGVIEPVCNRWRLPFIACIGYLSQSALYRAGRRILRNGSEYRQRTLILHLGDHDPSGIDMTRDNRARAELFSSNELGRLVDLKRIALNIDQVRRYKPPPNPAKETDSRIHSYAAEFGHKSWELDALDPKVIDRLIEDAVLEYVDLPPWEKNKRAEAKNRNMISDAGRKIGVTKMTKGRKK